MKNSKLWSIGAVALAALILLAAGGITVIVDPFFHYHAPLQFLSYPLNNQRYQNDGIVRHFDYDALITGTSMTENFKPSEFDTHFGTNTIKVTYSGGTYQEITSNLRGALEYNSNIRYVLYAIEEWFLFAEKDLILADGAYPTYLYDQNPFNDVNYLLNKEILLENTMGVLQHTVQGKPTTSFDEYSAWEFPTGAEAVLSQYTRPEIREEAALVTPELENRLRENLRTNLVELAKQYPDTQFLYFFPPYSILNWDIHQREKTTEQIVEGFRLATEVLLEAPNIQVYSFYLDTELVTDLDNYRDVVHYHAGINSLLLERISRGEFRLTKENAREHWDQVYEFYTNYDYEALFS